MATSPERREKLRARAQERLNAMRVDGKTDEHVRELFEIYFELEFGDAPPDEVPTAKRRPTPAMGFGAVVQESKLSERVGAILDEGKGKKP